MFSAKLKLQLDKLFGARKVAIIGASGRRADATGNRVIRNLQASRYEGEIYVVNPSATHIEGIASLTDIAQLPALDVAVVTLPAFAVAEVVEKLEKIGCPIVLVLSVGMTDTEVNRIEAVHRRGSTVVHGPNCMGILNVSAGVPLWADEGVLTDLPVGGISIVSQSGSGAIFVARSVSDVGFAKVISTGNEAGASTASYVSWLADDSETKVIGLVVESISDATAFASAVGRAHSAGKRVIALKVGRTERGAVATTAHTGALLSSDAAYVALFRRLGVSLVSDYDELASALQVVASLGPTWLPGKRIAVITISGGQAALAADLAETAGLTMSELSCSSRAQLEQIFPGATINNPLDAAAGPENFRTALEVLAADPGVDAVLVILDTQSSLNEAELNFEDGYFEAAFGARSQIPILIASSSSMSIHPRRSNLGKGVPIVRGIRNALVAIDCAATRPIAVDEPRPTDLPDERTLADIRRELTKEEGPLSQEAAQRLLRTYGLTFVQSTVTDDLAIAAEWAASVGYPVVLKISSPDISHRSDIGGVITNISGTDGLVEAWRSIHENVRNFKPSARIVGMELQKQVEGQIEALIGFVSDERLGATVGVGMGGVLVELLKDTAQAVAPVSSSEARSLIGSTRLGSILSGYRNLHPTTPLNHLASFVSRLSWLAFDLGDIIGEVDLNPVMIEPGSGRVQLVDALIIVRRSTFSRAVAYSDQVSTEL